MTYDYGTDNTFKIIYFGERDLESIFDDSKYPVILQGEGHGMLDDLCDSELKEIVESTDKLGRSTYHFTSGYEKMNIFDYRKYNIQSDNRELKGKILSIKDEYEVRQDD